MDKNVVLQHKIEKERLENRPYTPREQVNVFKANLENSLIKIVTGPRRAGKSVFCFQLLKGKKYAYLNFDDENLLKIKNYDEIEPLLHEVYPGHEYIFLDEIQNLENWELFVNKLHRRGANLIITGSNAKLLAREMATALTGRYVSAEVFPFSFTEYLSVKEIPVKTDSAESRGRLLSAMDDYMNNGGFPETTVLGVDGASYLSTLFDAVIFKDVAARHKVRVPKEIYDLALFMVSNPSCEFSFRQMAKQTGMKSAATLIKYASYLEESYIFELLNRFSFGVKKQLKSPKKIFLSDNGFMAAKGLAATKNTGRLFENLIYSHLRRQGYEKNKSLFYYRSDSGDEIDFVLKKGMAVEKLVQVCYDISAPKTFERELKSLVLRSEELRCDNLQVFTWDTKSVESYKGKKISITPAWEELTAGSGPAGV
jgi:hypothetical protein